MTNSFLDYYKTILTKVSFDRKLFQKEYNKAINTLDADAASQLRHWLVFKGLLSHAEHESPLVGNETASANAPARPY